MNKQELKQFCKRQNQICGMINQLSRKGKITQSQATEYTGLVLFNLGTTPEYLEEIAKELSNAR